MTIAKVSLTLLLGLGLKYIKPWTLSGLPYLPHYTSINSISPKIIDCLSEIQKRFLWKNSKPKIKDERLRKCYEHGGLKNFDV